MATEPGQRVERRARKPHLCLECRRTIAIGERYTDERFAQERTVVTWRSHVTCWTAARSWDTDRDWSDDEYQLLDEVAGGHLPPCPLAWRHHALTEPPPACECPPPVHPDQTRLDV